MRNMFHHPSHSSTTIYSPKQLPKSILTTSRTLYSYTLNPFSKSPARDDLLINFLVSLFTPYKNFTSVPFNLGRMCLKQISSHFTTTSHKESLCSQVRVFLFLVFLVVALDDPPLSFPDVMKMRLGTQKIEFFSSLH